MPDTWTERAIAAVTRIRDEAEKAAAEAWSLRNRVLWHLHTERQERAEAALKKLEVRAAARAPSLAELWTLAEQLRKDWRVQEMIAVQRRIVLTALRAANGHRERALAASRLARRTFFRRLAELPAEIVPPAPPPVASPEWTLPPDAVILTALRAHGGNRSAACRSLGLHPQALQRWTAKQRTRSAK